MKRLSVYVLFLIVVVILAATFLVNHLSKENTAEKPTTASTSVEVQSSDQPIVAQELDTLFNAPIEFYGKVVDSEGDSIPKVTVKFTVIDKYNYEDAYSTYEILSDDNGGFSIDSISGFSLSNSVEKDGYKALPSVYNGFLNFGLRESFINSPRFPTKSDPALFVLQKLANEPENLIFHPIRRKLPTDGTEIIVDLLKARISDDGDVSFQLTSAFSDEDNSLLNWKCLVKIKSGGFTLINDDIDYEAPVNSYQEQVEFASSEGDEGVKFSIERDYYYKFRYNDKILYGRMSLLVNGKGGFSMNYFYNPSGSRVLNSNK